MLVSWFQNLPSFLRSDDSSAPDLQDARRILKWRYQNTRSLLHRPIILDMVIRRAPLESLLPNHQIIVSKCRDIAADSIFSIRAEWRSTKICCWNAEWFLFQACLIPLMALAVESTDHCEYKSWCNQVQVGILTCEDMIQLTPAGPKKKAFLERMFLAVTNASSVIPQFPESMNSQPRMDTIMGLLEDDSIYFCENDAFPQFDFSSLSYLDRQILPQDYQPHA